MLFGTTLLIYLVMLMIWETNFFLATAFFIGFGFIDMVFTTGPPSPTLHKADHQPALSQMTLFVVFFQGCFAAPVFAGAVLNRLVFGVTARTQLCGLIVSHT